MDMNEELRTKIWRDNAFYIHLDAENIGKRINPKPKIDWQKHKDRAIINVKAQYANLFESNIKSKETKTDVLKALSKTMKFSSEEDLIEHINKELGEKLQKEINVQRLSSLHSIVNSGEKSIYKMLESAISTKNVEKLKEVLNILTECLKLLEKTGKEDGKDLWAILLNSYENANSFQEIGSNLLNALNEYKINSNYRIIKQQSLTAAKNLLDNLGYVLSENKFKSTGNDLSVNGLSVLISNNIISTALAQCLGFAINSKASSLLKGALIESVGTAQVEFDQTLDEKITGKKDINIEGVHYELKASDQGPTQAAIDITIGISSKFYVKNKFYDLSEKNGNQNIISRFTVDSGTGGTLSQAINNIFESQIDKYLVYNYFVHKNENSDEIKNMNDLILKRQILRLFATTGSSKDFNLFMLINGQIISIWDILQYAIDTNNYLGSRGYYAGQGLTLRIEDRSDIREANKKIESLKGEKNSPLILAWQRSTNVNKVISQARIKASLHLKNLAKYYEGSKDKNINKN